MRVLTSLLCLSGFLCCAATAQAQTPTDAQKLAFIQQNFAAVSEHSFAWQYGWLTIFGGSALINGVVWSATDSDKEAYDSKVGLVTSALGVGDLLLNPMRSHQYAERLSTEQVELAQAEAWLKAAAVREDYERSWTNHLLSGLVNGLAGLMVAYDDKRSEDGWLLFATNMLATEAKIFTSPRRMSQAWQAYQSGDLAALAAANQAAKQDEYRWQLAASGPVLHFQYRF